MGRRVLAALLVWVCLAGGGAAQALTFPALTGRVVDEAGLLSADERAALTETLAALEAKTTDQLVVVTLKSLQGTAVEDYGYQLGRHWQIGQKDKNNGVLLIVAPNDRVVRIEVGYGLEGTLTDALTKVIIETAILPRFKTGDYAGGIQSGVASLAQVLTGDTGGWQPRAGRGGVPGAERPAADEMPVGGVIVLVLLGVGLLIFCVTRGGTLCLLILMSLGRGGGSSRGRSGGGGFGGGGGSFGGGGSSGRW